MQYQVPQNIDIEDKILGPLTVRQFLTALVFFGIDAAIFMAFEPTPDVVLVMIIVGILGLAFVFARPLDLRFEEFLVAFLMFNIKSKKRIWYKVPVKEVFLNENEGSKNVRNLKDKVEISEIESLTEILDSGGRAALNSNRSKLVDDLERNQKVDLNYVLNPKSFSESKRDFDKVLDYDIDFVPEGSPSFENVFRNILIIPDSGVRVSSFIEDETLRGVSSIGDEEKELFSGFIEGNSTKAGNLESISDSSEVAFRNGDKDDKRICYGPEEENKLEFAKEKISLNKSFSLLDSVGASNVYGDGLSLHGSLQSGGVYQDDVNQKENVSGMLNTKLAEKDAQVRDEPNQNSQSFDLFDKNYSNMGAGKVDFDVAETDQGMQSDQSGGENSSAGIQLNEENSGLSGTIDLSKYF